MSPTTTKNNSTPSRRRCDGNVPVTGLFTLKIFGSVANISLARRRVAKAWVSVSRPSRMKCSRKNSGFGFWRPFWSIVQNCSSVGGVLAGRGTYARNVMGWEADTDTRRTDAHSWRDVLWYCRVYQQPGFDPICFFPGSGSSHFGSGWHGLPCLQQSLLSKRNGIKMYGIEMYEVRLVPGAKDSRCQFA
jgi:hypothetical protein